MDKIGRIKRLVETSLNTSFGGDIHISDMMILPTQKFDEMTNEWIPDSHTIFLSLKKNQPHPTQTYYNHYEGEANSADARKVTILLESLLGFECCVDFV